MNNLDHTTLYLLNVIALKTQLKAALQKNDISNPQLSVVGINFANILAGNLYPETGSYKNTEGLRQKKVASHLYCVNQLFKTTS